MLEIGLSICRRLHGRVLASSRVCDIRVASVGKSHNPEDDQVIDGSSLYKQQPSKKTCGLVLHYRYSDRKKASIVSEPREIQSRRDEVIPNSGMTPLNSIGQKRSISISKSSK